VNILGADTYTHAPWIKAISRTSGAPAHAWYKKKYLLKNWCGHGLLVVPVALALILSQFQDNF